MYEDAHIIAYIKVECEGQIDEYYISDNEEESNPENNIIFHERLFWTKALEAYINKAKKFEVYDTVHKILSIETFGIPGVDYPDYSAVTKDFTSVGDPVPVYVFQKYNKCQNQKHFLTEINAVVYSIKQNRKVEIDVSFCEDCELYFINRTSLEGYWGKYGLLGVSFIDEESYVKDNSFSDYKGYNRISKLASYGYSVSQNGPSSIDREKLIVYLIENELMTKSEIKGWIEYLLTYRGHLFEGGATERWKSDLDFVNEYNMKRQRSVFAYLIRK